MRTSTGPAGPWLALAPLLVLAGLLRLARLGFQPLWWDEGWSLYFATADARTMLALTAVDIHPPLYYLLLHLWIGVFGPTPLSVRALSVLLGVLAVPLVYVTGRRLFGSRTGWVAALLLAVSPFHVYYSQEVRMYGLVTLLGLAALAFAVQASSGGRSWLGYVLAAAAALYTQYYAAFLLLGLNVAMAGCWWFHRERIPHLGREVRAWATAQSAVAALYLPWALFAGSKLLAYVRNKVSADQDLPLGFLTYLGRHLAAFNWGHPESPLAWWPLALFPLGLLALALLVARRTRPGAWQPAPRAGVSAFFLLWGPSFERSVTWSGWAWPAAVLGVSLGCGYLVNLVFPFNPAHSERLLLLALPAYLLLLAAALSALWARRRVLALVPALTLAVLGIGSLGLFYTVPRYPGDDYRPVAARIRALARPADAIVCVHPWQVGYFQSYLPDAAVRPQLVLAPSQVLPRERQLWADDPTRMAADLQALLVQHRGLWLPAHQAMGRVLEGRLERYLDENAYPVLSEWHGGNTLLFLYAQGTPAQPGTPARFGNWLVLDEARLTGEPLAAGEGLLLVDLVWRPDGAAPIPEGGDRVSVGLRLADTGGYVWAHRDALPFSGLGALSDPAASSSRVDRHGLLIPAGTPPGEYRITLRVYRGDDLVVLPAVFKGGSGGEVALATVQVVRPAAPLLAEALAVEHRLRADFDGTLRLLGFSLPAGSVFGTGEGVEVELGWQALQAPYQDLLPRLQLVDEAGAVRAEGIEKPVMGAYPTAWWEGGELVRDPHRLPVPAATPPGRYRLMLSLLRADDGALLPAVPGGRALDLAEIVVEGREHVFTAPSPAHVQTAAIGPHVALAGYDLPADHATPGAALALTLYWHARETPDRNYDVFVHLLDTTGRIAAQDDGAPGKGRLPTLGWLPGEYLADAREVPLPPDLSPGEYRLEVGLYEPSTWARPGEPVLLDTPVQVEPEP